jgi:pimeloyl-ACP methyl ester carboxylesterase
MTVGHAAGAHAALWIAARRRLPPESAVRGETPLPIRAAVAIDGPGEFDEFVGRDAQVCGKPVVLALMGGTVERRPSRYFEATPAALLPLGARQVLVAATSLTTEDANEYRAKAEVAGDQVAVLDLSDRSGHFEPIAPATPQGAAVVDLILANVPPPEPRR